MISLPGFWVDQGIVEVRPDASAKLVRTALRLAGPNCRLQFAEPLPPPLLRSIRNALSAHPEVGLRVYGTSIDDIGWLAGFHDLTSVAVELWNVQDLTPVASLAELRELHLGETKARNTPIGWLAELQQLECLSVESLHRGLESSARLPRLRRLELRTTKVRTLDFLTGHPSLESFSMDFGGIRDLAPLVTIPNLRSLELYQVRSLTSEDLSPLAAASLEAISLGALRHVTDLGPVANSRLRYLILEGVRAASFTTLSSATSLTELACFDARPHDRRLTPLLELPLRHIVLGDTYDQDEVERLRAGFMGDTLDYRGERLVQRGTVEPRVAWRGPAHDLLT